MNQTFAFIHVDEINWRDKIWGFAFLQNEDIRNQWFHFPIEINYTVDKANKQLIIIIEINWEIQ